MFRKAFSFEGRIRRREFGLSIILYCVGMLMAQGMVSAMSRNEATMPKLILFIPLIWFYISQRTKRCHDLGNSGWFQLIPLYGFWMLFADGMPVANEYGDPPKPFSEYFNSEQEDSPENTEQDYISEEDEKNLSDVEDFNPHS